MWTAARCVRTIRGMPRTTSAVQQQTQQPSPQPLWSREGQLLADLLREREIGQTAFADQIGVRFHNVHRWCKGFEFSPANQRMAARGLNLPDDHFGPQTGARGKADGLAIRLQMERLETETREALGRFLRESPIADHLTPEELSVLRSVRFHDEGLRPTKAFFEAVTYALKGAIRRDEIMATARLNASLDESLARKPSIRRR